MGEIDAIGGLGGVAALGSASGTAAAKAGASVGAASGSGGTSFVDMLKKSLDEVNRSQNAADQTAAQFQTGQNNVSLEDAMISMQKANISFQAAVQVRNRLVSAYTDVMNMQI
jgi:flagellar hook-basal body complex protein FliE